MVSSVHTSPIPAAHTASLLLCVAAVLLSTGLFYDARKPVSWSLGPTAVQTPQQPPHGTGQAAPPFGPFAGCGAAAGGGGWHPPRHFWSGLSPGVQPESLLSMTCVLLEYDIRAHVQDFVGLLRMLQSMQVSRLRGPGVIGAGMLLGNYDIRAHMQGLLCLLHMLHPALLH